MGLASVGASPFLESGLAWRALPGEKASGDRAVVHGYPGGVLVAVVDGLGHGPEAAVAAERAVVVLEQHGPASLIALVRRCHEQLIGTRGAVMTLAAFNVEDDTVTWLGVGNVEGVLLHVSGNTGHALEAVVQRGGVVGGDLPALRATITTAAAGDVMVLASDGVRPDFATLLRPDIPMQRLADDILAANYKGNDDAVVLAVRYRGAGG